jgi:uncharacterized repeat protein (TIGR04138 family)
MSNSVPETFDQKIAELCQKDKRYDSDAYAFVCEALNVTIRSAVERDPKHKANLSGRELLNGIKDYALQEFGPMAFTVFTEWGLHESIDFGEIVFNLVAAGLLGTTARDSKEDFRDVFTFREVFEKPYLPRNE